MLQAVVVALSPNPEPGLCESYELTRFQQLAVDVGVSEDELRLIIRKLIAKKLGWATPRRVMVCTSCGSEFELSDRRARELVAKGEPRCLLCRHETMDPPDMAWLKSVPAETLEAAVAAMSALAA